MTMTPLNALLTVAVLALAPALSAASSDSPITDDYMNLLRVDLRATKAQVVVDSLEFTPQEAERFWEIYQEYDGELTRLNSDRVAVLREFSENYAKIDDAKAEDISRRTFEFQKRRLGLLEKYYNKVSKAFSPTTAARFAQLEYQLLMLIDVQIASELPLVPRRAIVERLTK